MKNFENVTGNSNLHMELLLASRELLANKCGLKLVWDQENKNGLNNNKIRDTIHKNLK